MKIKDDAGAVIETYTYGVDRKRLVREGGSTRTYFAWRGTNPNQEYSEGTAATNPVYSKSYVYAGTRLLSTATNTGSGTTVEFHHPDRLGTKVVTKPSANTYFEQSTMPFGTAFGTESNGATNQRFTSYDRNESTKLDYALNRTYSPGMGRFTQVDPIGMKAVQAVNPQSVGMFAYAQNDPVDFEDPDGLLRIQQCRRDWAMDSAGNIVYTDWTCKVIFDDGGGTGGGGGGGGGGATARDAVPRDCVTALKDLGVWDKVKNLLQHAPLFDVDKIALHRGADFFGENSRADETVRQAYDRLGSGYDALTVRTKSGQTGIYYRSSQVDLSKQTQLLLHELTHLFVPDGKDIKKGGDILDRALVDQLNLIQNKRESYSDTVSRFFNKNCDPSMRRL